MKKLKRIFALAGAAALVLMYILTLVFALRRDPAAGGWFFASLGLTIFVPVMLYAFRLVGDVVRPTKSPVIDTILYPASLFDAAALTGSEWTAEKIERAEDFLDSYREKGYQVFALSDKEIEDGALRTFAHEHGLEPSRSILIGDKTPLIEEAKERGFLAFPYENPAQTIRMLDKLGVH